MRGWWPLVAVCMGSFMFLVDTTIVAVALPSVAAGLHTSLEGLQWVANVYTLVLAVLMLAAGSLADRYGHRRAYVTGLAVFAAASAGCALAPNAGTLIAARGVQGIGGAAMAVTAFSLIGGVYKGRAMGTAMGVWGAVSGLGAAAGPMLGGVLTEFLGWRAIFFVNLPITVATIALTLRVIRPDERAAPSRRTSLDPSGMVLFAVCAGALTHALTRAGADGWGSSQVLGGLAVAAAALALFTAAELRHRHPLLDLRLFREPAFAAVMACVLASSVAFACLIYTSIWLQSSLGLGPVRTGVAMIPMALTTFVVSTVCGRAFHRLSPKIGMGGGLLLSGVGCALQADLDGGSTASSITLGLVVTGAGVGLMIPAMGTAVLAAAPAGRRGMAAGAMTTFRQLGQTLGVAALGVLFQDGTRDDPAAVAKSLDHVYMAAALIGMAAAVLAFATVRHPAPSTAPGPSAPDESSEASGSSAPRGGLGG
ncbi:MFS transporter [Actinomadura rubrisoli]|uniref:DHA2 family efflux MFS transporter permease subunit n=1 Tax=Actinomadura rubrisoli TaxID=2530368 RepID=A0A4R4ZYY4_9ACTN|nr:MFS transporter [Actinomadura rubrisoli]TDD63594.1 DHA2 family efflux MFS transporter permease subunit [Actinomadura rubrisoli]